MKCVLILEDEPFIAMDLTFAFEDEGAKVVAVVSCREAREAIERNAFDGAVLDVNLGGGETCEETARELKRRNIPFLLNTGDLNRAGEFLRGMEAPVIQKPTPSDQVVKALFAMG